MRLSTPPEDVADFVKDCRRDVRGDCCEREAEVRFCERVIGISIELLFGCVKGRFSRGEVFGREVAHDLLDFYNVTHWSTIDNHGYAAT